MYFLIEDDNLLDRYNTIWNKVSTDLRKELHNEPAGNKKFLKTKIKFYCVEVQIFTIKEFLIWTLLILV